MLEYSVVSNSGREDLYAELLFDDYQFGEILFDKKSSSFKIKIYPQKHSTAWQFNYDDFYKLITDAKNRLAEVEGIK